MDRAVTGIALSPAFEADGTGFAATRQGLLRTTDGGKNWSQAFVAIPDAGSLPVTAVAVSPRFDRDGFALAAVPGGIGRSTNRGATWQFARLPLPAPDVSALAIAPDARLAVAASLQDGIFRSEDAGQTWSAWNFGLLDCSVRALAISPAFPDDRTIFAGTSTGLARSRNGGRSWRSVDLPGSFPAITAIAATVGPVVVGTETAGLFCSPDGGSAWHACGEMAVGSLVALAASDRTIVALTDAGLFVSHDLGQAWSRIDTGLVAESDLTCVALADPGMIMAGDRSGELHRISL